MRNCLYLVSQSGSIHVSIIIKKESFNLLIHVAVKKYFLPEELFIAEQIFPIMNSKKQTAIIKTDDHTNFSWGRQQTHHLHYPSSIKPSGCVFPMYLHESDSLRRTKDRLIFLVTSNNIPLFCSAYYIVLLLTFKLTVICVIIFNSTFTL